MSWKWFGVKTVYRWEAIGEPQNLDDYFDENASLVEERIVLIKARNFNEASKRIW